MLYWRNLLYMSEIVRINLISKYYNYLLAGHFRIDKTQELIARNYYWSTLYSNVKAYITGFDLCPVLKVIRYKLYKNLQSLEIPIH